jgi:hypothetical protein
MSNRERASKSLKANSIAARSVQPSFINIKEATPLVMRIADGNGMKNPGKTGNFPFFSPECLQFEKKGGISGISP